MKYELHYGAASAAVEFRESMCFVDLRGPVTRQVLEQSKIDLVARAPADTHVIIARWDRAILAADINDMGETILDGPRHPLMTKPLANVVDSAHERIFQQHAFRMIQHGLVRVTFCSWDAALAWAVRKVAVAEMRESAKPRAPAAVLQALGSSRAGSRRRPSRVALRHR